MDILSNFPLPLILFLLTLVFGFWMGKVGRPYNGILFNIHKLIALGTVILAAIQVYKLFTTLEPQTLIVVLTVIIAVCVIAIFASGAFLSIGNQNYQTMKIIHNAALVLAVIAMGLAIYFLWG